MMGFVAIDLIKESILTLNPSKYSNSLDEICR